MSNLDNIPNFGDIPIFPQVEIARNDWKMGLIVRAPNWLGDAIMAIPAMMQLKKIVPKGLKFIVIVPPGLSALFATLDFVDVTIALHQAHAAWTANDIKAVKEQNAGVAILMNNSLRDAFYLKRAKVPKLFGASARGRSFLLKKSFKFPKIKNQTLNKLHHAGRYLAMSYALGAPEWDGTLPQFYSLKGVKDMSPEVLSVFETKKLLVIAPGAAYGPAKQWPASSYREVCRHWLDNGGEVAIIGTEKEVPVAEEVSADLPGSNLYNLAGLTDMHDLLNILKHAEMCVANDSGIMHMSAILGKKGVAIFGSTDPTSTSPVSKLWKIMYERQSCSPCFNRTCSFNNYTCLNAITPQMVIANFSE